MSEEFKSAGCNGECGSCGSDCENREEGNLTITLQMDNGETVDCAILTVFEANSQEYIVLLPLNEEGMADSEEVFIYRYNKEENGTTSLENIADDEEYAEVAIAFEQYLAQLRTEEELSGIVGTELN